MADPDQGTLGAIVVTAAFLPPLVYLIWVRNVEKWNREPWFAVFRAFFYGAIISVVFALLLEGLFAANFHREYSLGDRFEGVTLSRELLLVVVAAPLAEEFTKGLGVRGARRQIREIEDGIVYGAAAGLGFSATENLIYELAALFENPEDPYAFIGVAVLRSITASFLHATATGVLGYGMARRYLERRMLIELLPFYALAVLLHSAFNALATFIQVAGFPIAGAMLVILVSVTGMRWTVDRIRHLDRRGAVAAYR